jgi:hypothetical protein
MTFFRALALEQQRLEAQRKDWEFGAGTDPARAGLGARSPLGFTGLVLAVANLSAKPGGDTGIVTGDALVSLPPEGLRLYVLSICETGLGEPRAGHRLAGAAAGAAPGRLSKCRRQSVER